MRTKRIFQLQLNLLATNSYLDCRNLKIDYKYYLLLTINCEVLINIRNNSRMYFVNLFPNSALMMTFELSTCTASR